MNIHSTVPNKQLQYKLQGLGVHFQDLFLNVQPRVGLAASAADPGVDLSGRWLEGLIFGCSVVMYLTQL